MDRHQGHPSLSRMYDWAIKPESFSRFTPGHIETCEECQAKADWLKGVMRSARLESTYEPPNWAIANAINFFRLKRPSAVRFAEQVLATLVYDSFNDPLPRGIRQRDLPARQTLYQAEGVQLDLKVQVMEDDKGLIIGQIVSEDADFDVKGLGIALSHEGELIGASETNALGEFVFEHMPKGDYELIVQFGDKLLRLPGLPLGE
jgi:hypothetical protein